MPWFQVDDDLPTHPDMLATSLAARGLWVTAGAWCSKRLTDVVPDHVLASFGSTPELETELGAQGVWKRVRKGWRFTQNGLCKVPVKATVERTREKGAARQRRWYEAHHNGVSNAAPNAVSNGVPIPVPNTPQPPASGGHDGSHPNCRACGTNPRGVPPPPPRLPTPPPVDQAIAAARGSSGRPLRGDAVTSRAAAARAALHPPKGDPP